ncbi:MAG: putative isomerase YddE [Thermoanaerobaculia bacterium]|nr:putative isomerase YddE [Thermoanaerobaculia bacterium]
MRTGSFEPIVLRMKVRFVTCDVFTKRRFTGNPLLVVPDARELNTPQMQAIAREINYSESTFVLPADDPRNAYRQRTFVPTMEIPYAGHPTIGTATVLATLGLLPRDARKITIEVGFGPLGLELFREDGRVEKVQMEQGTPRLDSPVTDPALLDQIARAIGLTPDSFRDDLPVQAVSTGNKMLMVPLRDLSDLSRSILDLKLGLSVEKTLGVLVIYPFVWLGAGQCRARGFCSDAGIGEDPATGSAAGPLGIYLGTHGIVTPQSPAFRVDQGIEMGRPSEIGVETEFTEGKPSGVKVSGSAVLMMEGTIEV